MENFFFLNRLAERDESIPQKLACSHWVEVTHRTHQPVLGWSELKLLAEEIGLCRRAVSDPMRVQPPNRPRLAGAGRVRRCKPKSRRVTDDCETLLTSRLAQSVRSGAVAHWVQSTCYHRCESVAAPLIQDFH